MKAKIFCGVWYKALDAFNKWAKGKALTKEILIHTHVYGTEAHMKEHMLDIIVIHPEDPQYDKTEPHITAPLHTKPEPHIKIEEIKVIQ